MKLTWIFLLSMVLVYLYMSQPADSWRRRRFRFRVRVGRFTSAIRRATNTIRRVVRRITHRHRASIPRFRLRRIVQHVKTIIRKPPQEEREMDDAVKGEKCLPICLLKKPQCQNYFGCSNEWVCPTTCQLFKDDEVSTYICIYHYHEHYSSSISTDMMMNAVKLISFHVVIWDYI